jgi:phage shock protein A
LAAQIQNFSKLKEKLQANIHTLSNKILEVEYEKLILKQMLPENEAQKALHPSSDALHVEILDLKNKQEEIQAQRVIFKQEIETHITSWA